MLPAVPGHLSSFSSISPPSREIRHRSLRNAPSPPEGPVKSKPPQSHRKATAKPYCRHILGIDSGVQSHPKATPKPHQSHTKATPKPHQCDLQGKESASSRITFHVPSIP